jgi:hypothetical protein
MNLSLEVSDLSSPIDLRKHKRNREIALRYSHSLNRLLTDKFVPEQSESPNHLHSQLYIPPNFGLPYNSYNHPCCTEALINPQPRVEVNMAQGGTIFHEPVSSRRELLIFSSTLQKKSLSGIRAERVVATAHATRKHRLNRAVCKASPP